jgi:hypothetical protein
MKTTRYLAIALVIVVILAAIGWVLRNSIIERLSGPMLAEYGLSISDVSLDALATETATISHLELEHANGTTIIIDDLTLPFATSAGEIKTYIADKLTLGMPEGDDRGPVAIAQLIDQILLLPETLPETVVAVGELSVSGYPVIRNIQWASIENRQLMTASLGVVDLSLTIETIDGTSFEATLMLDQTSLNDSEQSFLVEIELTDNGVRINSMSALDLPALGMIATSLAESFGLELAGVEFANGSVAVHYAADVPYDTTLSTTARTSLITTQPFEFAYSVKPGIVNVVSVRSASVLTLESTYPEGQWALSVDEVSLLASFDDWQGIDIEVANLDCTSEMSCSMDLKAATNKPGLNFATAGRLEFEARQEIALSEELIQLTIHPDARLSLVEIDVDSTGIESINAQLLSSATLDLSDSGWQLSADSIDAVVDSLSVDETTTYSAPISLSALSADDVDQALTIETMLNASLGKVRHDGTEIALPGFDGKLTLRNENVSAQLTTIGLYHEADIKAQHSLSEDTGSIQLSGAILSFDALTLSDRVSPWPNDWNISAGTVSFDLQFNWNRSDSGWQLDGQSSAQLTSLAGHYTDTVFAGLSTNLAASFDAGTGISVEPANMRVALLEIGLPVENISADYLLHPETLSVDVQNLEMNAFGGRVTADPFTYEVQAERNTLLLRAESIELAELLTVKEFDAIELSGTIGAELPVVIEGTQVSILDGTLTGEKPGGVIRYQSDVVPGETDASAIGIVTEALSNFEYDTLTSTVGYNKDGDLILQMQIAGRNPDMEDSRPVVLNLGVENNIPQMLRSLQAARAVEEILEKRVKK